MSTIARNFVGSLVCFGSQVTPEQAEKLVLAANESRLKVVMRKYSEQ